MRATTSSSTSAPSEEGLWGNEAGGVDPVASMASWLFDGGSEGDGRPDCSLNRPPGLDACCVEFEVAGNGDTNRVPGTCLETTW